MPKIESDNETRFIPGKIEQATRRRNKFDILGLTMLKSQVQSVWHLPVAAVGICCRPWASEDVICCKSWSIKWTQIGCRETRAGGWIRPQSLGNGGERKQKHQPNSPANSASGGWAMPSLFVTSANASTRCANHTRGHWDDEMGSINLSSTTPRTWRGDGRRNKICVPPAARNWI